MTAQLKRFPKTPAQRRTPEQQAAWVKNDRLSLRLQALARKADLLAWALQGVMALEENDAAWPIQDGAYELKDELEAIAEEIQL